MDAFIVDLDPHPGADQRDAVAARRTDAELPRGLAHRAREVRSGRIVAELDAIILRLLAKDPKQRHQSCRELAQELGAIRDTYA